MNAIFDSIFKQHFPVLSIPPNWNLPDGCSDEDISPEPEQPPSEYVDDGDEPRERDE